ncbi:MAG: rubredoxin, partial [Nitrosospira sp.]
MSTTETLVYRCYMCLICGYVYDEAEGSPQEGIPP